MSLDNHYNNQNNRYQEPEDQDDCTINYGDPAYWEERYASSPGERFDWLEDFDSLREILEQYLSKPECRILNIGCGNGYLQDQMYRAGYHNIVNIDISRNVIDQLTQSSKDEYPLMQYKVMDALKMDFEDCSFDLAIDKSTIDAFLCSQSPLVSTARLIYQTWRVLRPGGVYIAISYGDPNSREEHINRWYEGLSLEKIVELPPSSTHTPHYVYVCRRKQWVPDPKVITKIMNQLAQQEKGMLEQEDSKPLQEKKKSSEKSAQRAERV